MGQKLDNAVNLYLEGIKEGDINAVDEYTGSRYTQHSTGVKDGTSGFKEFFKGFLERTTSRKISIIRGFEDGNFVFVQAYQDIDDGTAKWITTDLFDTDNNDKIIEHWDVISEYKEANQTVSGNDMILGEFEIKDTNKTEANKALVRSYLTEIYQNKNIDKIGNYVSQDTFIQHNPKLASGIEALKTFLEKEDYYYDFVFKVIGQGNYVVSYSKAIHNTNEMAIFDIFRIENGKIVEHWDNAENILPRSSWLNSGKF